MTGRTKIILSVVGVLAVAVATFFLAVKPRQDELGRVRNQVAKEEDRTQSLEAELAHRQQLQKNAPQLEAQIEQGIPASFDFDSTIEFNEKAASLRFQEERP